MKYILYGGARRGGRTMAIREALRGYPGNILHRKRGEDSMLELHIKCKFCGTDHAIFIPIEAYAAWTQGAAIQDAMPMLSPGERELLISGVCEACFDNLMRSLDND